MICNFKLWPKQVANGWLKRKTYDFKNNDWVLKVWINSCIFTNTRRNGLLPTFFNFPAFFQIDRTNLVATIEVHAWTCYVQVFYTFHFTNTKEEHLQQKCKHEIITREMSSKAWRSRTMMTIWIHLSRRWLSRVQDYKPACRFQARFHGL